MYSALFVFSLFTFVAQVVAQGASKCIDDRIFTLSTFNMCKIPRPKVNSLHVPMKYSQPNLEIEQFQ